MIYFHQMPDGSELVEWCSLPVRIREFVNSVRERNPERCWPFGSICDHTDLNDQVGQISLSDQNAPENTEAHESFEAERRNGNQVDSENENSADNEKQNLLILSLPEQNVPEDTLAPETSEQQRKHNGKAVAYEDSQNSENSANSADNEIHALERYSPENTENAEVLETSGVENQLNGKEIVVYQNPAEMQLVVYRGNHTPAEIDAAQDSDYDTSRTISDLPTATESRNIYRHRFKENVNRAVKNKNNPEKKTKNFKNEKFRRLSDINTELKDEKLEIPFPNYFVDDITLIFSRKRKAEKANLKKNKKKNRKHKANESPRFDEAEPSNRGVVGSSEPCGSRLVVGRVSRAKPSNLRQANRKESSKPCGSGSVIGRVRRAKPTNQRSSVPSGSRLVMGRVKKAKPLKRGPKRLKSDNEINDPRLKEAAGGLLCLGEEMMKEVKCRGLGECDGCEPFGSLSVVVVRAGEVNGSGREMEMAQDNEPESEDLVCTLNQNPADFSTEIAKRFMRI